MKKGPRAHHWLARCLRVRLVRDRPGRRSTGSGDRRAWGAAAPGSMRYCSRWGESNDRDPMPLREGPLGRRVARRQACAVPEVPGDHGRAWDVPAGERDENAGHRYSGNTKVHVRALINRALRHDRHLGAWGQSLHPQRRAPARGTLFWLASMSWLTACASKSWSATTSAPTPRHRRHPRTGCKRPESRTK